MTKKKRKIKKKDWKNRIIRGDCKDILESLYEENGEFVDMIYIDPPFFSGQDFDIVWGNGAELQAYKDSNMYWSSKQPDPKDVEEIKKKVESYKKRMESKLSKDDLEAEIEEFRKERYEELFGNVTKGSLKGYLHFMEERLWELKKVLKSTGTIFLHCDDHAVHHLRVILDKVFGENNFKNMITWQRTYGGKGAKNKFMDCSDYILFYSKTNDYVFNIQYEHLEKDPTYNLVDVKGKYKSMPIYDTSKLHKNVKMGGSRYFKDKNITITLENDKRWLWSQERVDAYISKGFDFYWTSGGKPRFKRYNTGKLCSDIWMKLYLTGATRERLGYPTQKPEVLLERIILTASNKGDVILDAFGGGGTTAVVASRLERKWVTMDISPRACDKMLENLERYGFHENISIEKYDWKKQRDLRFRKLYTIETWKDAEVIARHILGYRWIQDVCKKRGIDGIKADDDNDFLEVKKWNIPVGPGEIQKFYGKIKQYKATKGIFVADLYTQGVEAAVKACKKDGIDIKILTYDDLYMMIGKDALKKFKKTQIKRPTNPLI